MFQRCPRYSVCRYRTVLPMPRPTQDQRIKSPLLCSKRRIRPLAQGAMAGRPTDCISAGRPAPIPWAELLLTGGNRALYPCPQRGFGPSSRGTGISALFVRPSGTGKTMAAKALAGELVGRQVPDGAAQPE